MQMAWYHISETFLGEEYLFRPRVPSSRSIDEDSVTPRICVSDNWKKCLFGIFGSPTIPSGEYYLYELNSEAFKPTEDQVLDFYRTNEHWILVPTIGIYVLKIQNLTRAV